MVRKGASSAWRQGKASWTLEKQKVWTIAEILNKTAEYLGERGLDNPRLNAELMLGHVLGLKRIGLYLNHDRPLRDQELSDFRALVRRRLDGCPVQYLMGETEFFSLSFQVSPAALIPRPETEILVETVLKCLKPLSPPLKVADLGTGSGVIAVSLASHLPGVYLYAVDRSSDALELARKNATKHGVADRIRFFQGDLFEPLRGKGRSFAALVSNPPYVSSGQLESLPREIRLYEPLLALDGGPDGMEVIRRLVAQAPQFLVKGGILALEVGAGQAPSAGELMAKMGAFDQPQMIEDYAGVERVVVARASEQ